jgi:hypothetical protein
MSDDGDQRRMRIQLWGWILFVVCAGFFIASSLRNGDTLSLAGSIIFLIACILFIIPILSQQKAK